MSVKLLTPRKMEAILLRQRVDTLRAILPTNWIVLFLYEYPEYHGQNDFLVRVMAKKSLHKATIEKLEKLAEKLKQKKIINS